MGEKYIEKIWDEDALRLQVKAMVSRLNSKGLDLVIDYINKEYEERDMGITLSKVKAIGMDDMGLCPKSPNGIHAGNMSGCCVYCGKQI